MIRHAELGDEYQVGTVMSDWLEQTPWMPRLHSREGDVKFCRRLITTTTVWVLAQDDNITGFIAVDADNDVDALYLAPEARGQGHGKALLNVAKGETGRLELWVFQANTGAIAFYLREGFVEIKRTDGANNEQKLPDVRMQWDPA